MFSYKFSEIFQSTFFTEHFRMTASEMCMVGSILEKLIRAVFRALSNFYDGTFWRK